MPGLLEWLPGIKYGFIGTVVFAIDRDWQLMLGLLAMQLLAAVIGSTLIAIVLRHRGELLVMDQQHTLGPPSWF